MATVTGKTSAKIDELLSTGIVSASIDENNQLLFTTRGGATINAGALSRPIDAWPVGSIYVTISSTDPAVLLGGGNWVAWGSGRVPVGVDVAQTEFNVIEEIGGSKIHVLTTAQMPAHLHDIGHDHADASMGFEYATDVPFSGTGARITDIQNITAGGGTNGSASINIPSATGNSGNTGGGAAHNILQPYITCYMWKRVS